MKNYERKVLAERVPSNDRSLEYLDEVLNPLERTLKKLKTDKQCPRCRSELYLSDLQEYEYVCPFCDENFYEFEVIR